MNEWDCSGAADVKRKHTHDGLGIGRNRMYICGREVYRVTRYQYQYLIFWFIFQCPSLGE